MESPITEVAGLEHDYPYLYLDGPVPAFFYDRDSGMYYLTHGPANTPGVRDYPRPEGEVLENIALTYYNTLQAQVFGLILQVAAPTYLRVPLEAMDCLPGFYPYTAYMARLDDLGNPRVRPEEIIVTGYDAENSMLITRDAVAFSTPTPNTEDYAAYMEKPYYLVVYDRPIKKLFTTEPLPDEDELKIEMPGLMWSCRTHSYHLLSPLAAFAYANIGTDNWAKPLPYPESTVMDDCVPPSPNGFETPHVFENHMLHFDRYVNQWHSGGQDFWIPTCRSESQARKCDVAFYIEVRRWKVRFYNKEYFIHKRNWT